ncbi:hypothetical protein [Carboxylicivirga sp. N1Y90]|uniref:hypothetical protein n=1 Tax=Carboxylicivirga fragile TaxID=3417571 RepID=UPI003D3329A5|nr:hypothetical protein [Marinilabiliaceae bacterium N1Y90]
MQLGVESWLKWFNAKRLKWKNGLKAQLTSAQGIALDNNIMWENALKGQFRSYYADWGCDNEIY